MAQRCLIRSLTLTWSLTATATATWSILGCSSSPPPAPKEPAPRTAARAQRAPATPSRDPDEGMEISGSGVLGSLDEDQVQAPLQMHWNEIVRCKDGARPKPPSYVGGRVQLQFRIDRTGGVKKVIVAESSLGNWNIEKCILGIARGLHFSRPKGGEAEFTYPISFEGRGQMTEWSAAQVEAPFQKKKRDLVECRSERFKTPQLTLTFYLGPGGRVTSAGVASADELDDSYVECVLQKVSELRFPDPRGTLVRASYPLQ